MNDLKQRLQTEINAALATGISQNKLADQIGVSAATLINVRRGEWESLSEQMLMKLRGYFHINDWRIYETANMRAITEMCTDASQERKLVAVAGYTGSGKTTALRAYTRKHANTWYVLGTSISTQRSFLTTILKSMGITDGGNIQDKMSLIIREMNTSKDALLIIDDAGKLTDNILRLIQIIYDETEYNAGMVIAGTEYLHTYITKGAARDKRGFREIKRRITYWQPMAHPTRKEVEFICKDYGMSDTHAIQYCAQNAKDYGTIRNLITVAIAMSCKTGQTIDREMLEDIKVGSHHYQNITR